MTRSFVITTLFLLLISMQAFGQRLISGPETQSPESILREIPLPSMWGFTKYGNNNHNLYTGTVSASIPLYTYSDSDFTVPISLSYRSNGYMPGIQAGPVGLDWMLNVGGAITREVKGIPDEDSAVLGGQTTHGFLQYYSADPSKKPSYIFDRGAYWNRSDFFYMLNNQQVETTPDIFSFNFMGHTGKFMFGLNSVHFFNTNTPDGEFKLWFSTDLNHITITTGDGYEYYFQALEQRMTYSSSPTSLPDTKIIKPIVWKLFQITAPNKRFVKFNYGGMTYVDNYFPCARSGYQSTVGHNDWTGKTIFRSFFNVFDYARSQKTDNLLTSIEIGNKCKLVFSYTIRPNPERGIVKTYNGSETPQWAHYPLQNTRLLTRIEITKPSPDLRVFKTIRLGYGAFGARKILEVGGSAYTNQVSYLSMVNIPGEGDYVMNYYNEDTLFPFHGTIEVDHWGYYKGLHLFENTNMDSISRFMPNTTLNSDYSEHIDESDVSRAPNWEKARFGMLRSITYPTGGSSKFYYEPHDYNAWVTADYQSQNNPELRACNRKIAGGVRIQKQVNYTSATDSTVVTYTYKRKNQESSGILLHFPRYRTIWAATITNVSPGKFENYVEKWSPNDLNSYRAQGTHIEYEEVQVNYQDGSHTDYKFSSYRSVPDKLYSPNYVLVNQQAVQEKFQVHVPQYANNFFMTPYFMTSQRGKTLSSIVYNKDNELLRGTRNIYNYSKELESFESVEHPYADFFVARTYLDDYPLVTTRDIRYYNNGADSVYTDRNYGYNKSNQIVKITKTDSQGKVMIDSTMYVTDILDANRTEVEKDLVKYNKLSSPLLQIKQIQRGNDTRITEAIKYTYRSFMNNVYFQNKQHAVIDVPKLNLSGSEYVLTEEVCAYDSEARPLQVKNIAGVSTCYIWGYEGKYIVATIVNAELAQITAISGLTGIETAPLSGALNDIQIMSLRNIANTQVTTYDYDLFYGLISTSDMNGMVKSYEYDKTGRLKAIKDHDGRLINSYEYSNK